MASDTVITMAGHSKAPLLFTRREILISASGLGLSLSGCLGTAEDKTADTPATAAFGGLDDVVRLELERKLRALFEENDVPGFAAGLIRDARLVWTGGFGQADVDQGVPMTPETLLNIGSVTKTVTTTAVLQMIEQGKLNLDGDVSDHLDFQVRNPRHPETAITVRQLLAHRSSILDGDAYGESYVCGDQPRPLGEWLADYFTVPELEAHFHVWQPGELEPPESPRAYSNVAYGLLGHLVEKASGLTYEDYCRKFIFEPLGMRQSGFSIDRIDTASHAVPYSRIGEDFTMDDIGEDYERSALPRFSVEERPPVAGGLHPHCLYSFATPPDGLLRTSVSELARFLIAWINRGTGPQGEVQLLASETVESALSDAHFGRALCWSRSKRLPGEPLWNHSGGDPGIAAFAGFRAQEKSGLVLIFNVDDPREMFRGAIDVLLEALSS